MSTLIRFKSLQYLPPQTLVFYTVARWKLRHSSKIWISFQSRLSWNSQCATLSPILNFQSPKSRISLIYHHLQDFLAASEPGVTINVCLFVSACEDTRLPTCNTVSHNAFLTFYSFSSQIIIRPKLDHYPELIWGFLPSILNAIQYATFKYAITLACQKPVWIITAFFQIHKTKAKVSEKEECYFGTIFFLIRQHSAWIIRQIIPARGFLSIVVFCFCCYF